MAIHIQPIRAGIGKIKKCDEAKASFPRKERGELMQCGNTIQNTTISEVSFLSTIRKVLTKVEGVPACRWGSSSLLTLLICE
jgi:hypothetical protein